MDQKSGFIFYGWFIVIAGVVIGILGFGARYSFSVIFTSLLNEFQWPRDSTALILSIHLLFYALAAPLAGGLIDRIGPKWTMGLGTILLILGFTLCRFSSALWHFYLSFGVIAGSGLSLTGSTPLTTIIKNWFEKYRGTAISILFFGVGSAHILYPVIAYLIETFGWRNTFILEAVAIAIVFFPLVIFVIHYHPGQKGLAADGVSGSLGNDQAEIENATRIVDKAWTATDWTFAEARKTYRFWLLLLSSFSIWGVSQHILVAHHIAFAEDVGYSKMYASSVLSLYGIMWAIGSLCGFISDRFGREVATIIATIIGISGIEILTLINDTSHPWMLYYYSITAGFGTGMTASVIAAAHTDIFQGPRVGGIIGFLWFSFGVGGAIGPWVAGWIFEITGAYTLAFYVAIGMFVFGCVCVIFAAPRKIRLVPGKAVRNSGEQ